MFDEARLWSEYFTSAVERCFSFRFYTRSVKVSVCRLLVFGGYKFSDCSLWTWSRTTDGRWKNGQVELPSLRSQYAVEFRVSRTGYLGGIAGFDDIVMKDGSCF